MEEKQKWSNGDKYEAKNPADRIEKLLKIS